MQLLLQQAGRLIQEPDLTGVDLNLPKNWDIAIIPLKPSLVPLTSDSPYIPDLQGDCP